MKRFISLALCIILITLSTFSVFADPTASYAPLAPGKTVSTDDTEILRAISYGFVPDKLQGDWEKTITFSQYCTMLTNMLSRYDSKLIPQWKKAVARALASNDAMHRDHGMLATYYAACLMGIGQTTNGNWNYFNQVLSVDVVNGFDNNFDKWFPDCSKPSPFYDIEFKKRIPGWDYVTSSRFWCMGQFSSVSGNQIFEADFEHKTLRPMANFSRKEAIHAVLRLYESTLQQTDKILGGDKKSVEILALADKRRNAILNSITDIAKADTFIQGKTYTGKAYYVSNSGNDSNNGTSPETAWATVNRVNSADLKYGDAVFFKRGDIWFGDEIWGQPGITYTAYGTGPKPVFSGSVAENAATPDKWNLYYSGENGEKIWVYYRNLRDCSGIFFDDGKGWANGVVPIWNGKQYIDDTGKPFDVITGLKQNLDYFNCLDFSKIDPFAGIQETGVTGLLYLRCDEGNPGDLYRKIDFSIEGIGISPEGLNGKDMTIDNLKFVFWGTLGVSPAGYQGWTDTLVQNCEIGWCGGNIMQYFKIGKDVYANHSGGAIQMSGIGNKAVSNYIHHCASKTLVVAIHVEKNCSPDFSNIVMKGNLMEYNTSALHLVNYIESEDSASGAGSFRNISFDDNYVMYTGYGWVETKTQRTDHLMTKLPLISIEFGGDNSINKNYGISITNNIFYLSKYALVHCYMPKNNQPTFSGNIYAQGENGWLAMLRGRLLSITENGEKYVRDELLDKTGTVLTVK